MKLDLPLVHLMPAPWDHECCWSNTRTVGHPQAPSSEGGRTEQRGHGSLVWYIECGWKKTCGESNLFQFHQPQVITMFLGGIWWYVWCAVFTITKWCSQNVPELQDLRCQRSQRSPVKSQPAQDFQAFPVAWMWEIVMLPQANIYKYHLYCIFSVI